MKKTAAIIIYGVFLFLVSASELTVTVTDRELEIPLEGVTLKLTTLAISAQTDADGKAMLQLPESFTRGTLTAQLPGYDNQKATITGGQKELLLTMVISDVIEGKELVVERSAPGKTDAKPGVSVVMESREMESTAEMGLVEDIMSSVKTLPGVGFSGGWNAQPSIRGGYPDEMGTVLDGIYIIAPWHWGGAYSIFNPDMVDSVKMSHGIFSSRYGRAMSGLLEVTTIKPSSSLVRINTGIATTSTDFFAQIPFSANAGLFTGGKVTYMETIGWLSDALPLEPKVSDAISTMPYIRDFYAKGYYTPVPSLDISLNAFFGSDGVGVKADVENEGFRTQANFDWLNLQGFAGVNIKWMPKENAIIHFIGAYNNQTVDAKMKFNRSGSYSYSEKFLALYDGFAGLDTDGAGNGTINGQTSYTIDNLGMEGFSKAVIQQGQAKLETDILLAGSSMLSFGAEEVFQAASSKQKISGWQELYFGGNPTLMPVTFEQAVEGNRIMNSSVFMLWNFGSETSAVTGELGLRGEHFYLWNTAFNLNTWPVANPRFSIQWTPVRNSLKFESITLSVGTGFFSMFPLDAIAADKKFGIESFEVGPNRAAFQVLGAEFNVKENWLFKIEGYYKNYFNRLYLLADDSQTPVKYSANTDGTGYATGFDFMLQKKNGRKLDGYLSYSFVFAQYKNPATAAYENQTTIYGEPVGLWYYPDFHRTHNLNLIMNWKPASGMVFTLKASVATGTPEEKVGEIKVYAATLPDGRILERYSRTQMYDDTLRTDISCPVDVRFGYSNYYRRTKIRWEYYIGVENIFVNLYRPKSTPGFDEYTGKEIIDSGNADFSIGIPVPSIGYKISY